MDFFSHAGRMPEPGNIRAPRGASGGRRLTVQTLLFFSFFVLLYTSWTWARDSGLERLVIDSLTVTTAVMLINTVTPSIDAQAVGTRIRAPGGGINILNGCEGTDALFLLVAAVLASPVSWRPKIQGVVAGTLFVFMLNQGRILALFYSNRHDKELFNLLHGTVAPIILITATALFFFAWIQRHIARN